MRQLTIAVAAMLWIGGAGGCTPTDTVLITRTHRSERPPSFDRLMVVVNARSIGFSASMEKGLRDGMQHMLARCGVTARVGDPSIVEGVPDVDLIARGGEVQLRIERSGGTIYVGETTGALQRGELRFEVSLVIVPSSEIVWRADAELWITASLGGAEKAGRDLARRILTQLRIDGLLRGCPYGPLQS